MWANEFLSSTGRKGNLLLTTRNSVDGAGKETPVAKMEILFEGEESMEIYCMEEEEKEHFAGKGRLRNPEAPEKS